MNIVISDVLDQVFLSSGHSLSDFSFLNTNSGFGIALEKRVQN